MTVTVVDFANSTAYKVAQKLQLRHFAIASINGIRSDNANVEDNFGILQRQPREEWSLLGSIFAPKHRDIFVGTLWLNNPRRSATCQQWVLEVHGRKHLEPMKKLFTELTASMNTSVEIRLTGEDEQLERFMSDYDH